MASLSRPVGYECEFVDQVLEDYFCKQCKHVAREPNITSCCTEVLCKACFDVTTEDKQPCPSCESTDISSLGPHKKYQPRILALKVYCSLKDRGCEWTGQLQHLDAHLDLTTGDCVYVDVDCPSKCNQKVQKRNVDTHLANLCPNRDYTCPHCSFKATFHEVSEHFDSGYLGMAVQLYVQAHLGHYHILTQKEYSRQLMAQLKSTPLFTYICIV